MGHPQNNKGQGFNKGGQFNQQGFGKGGQTGGKQGGAGAAAVRPSYKDIGRPQLNLFP